MRERLRIYSPAMIRAAKELIISMFPHAFPNRNMVTMTFEVVEGIRSVPLEITADASDRLATFSGEPPCTLSTNELVSLFNADSHTYQYVGKRRRPRTRFG